MEVHAHTHTAGKKWTHYLWEFLMLFLAVFCGFLAENIREHRVEHKREKEYIRSLIRDLEKDTAELHRCIKGNETKKNVYDSLWTLLKQPDPDPKLLYYYFIPTTYYLPFHPTEGTIRQLENAGGLRLIRDQPSVDSIITYYSLARASEGQGNTFLRYFDKYHDLAFQVFDYSQIDTLFYSREEILTGDRKFTLLSNDKASIKVLFNKLYALWFILQSYISYLGEAEQSATATLAFLKKKYHIK